MDPRLQRRVQRYGWDRAADDYERYWSAQLSPAQQRMLALAELRPGERVVDVAAGTGLVTFPAAEAVGPEGVVVATDISTRMVELLQAEADGLGLGQVTAERMDGEALQLEPGVWDAALCGLGLMYFPDPVGSLGQMRELLRPGGRTAVAVWGARPNCGWAEIFPIVDSRVNTEVCPMFFQLGTGRALTIALESAGYERIRVERISTLLAYRGPEDAIGAAFFGGPVALAYSRFDEPTRDEAHAEYLESIEPYRRGDGYEIPGEFVVAVGEKS